MDKDTTLTGTLPWCETLGSRDAKASDTVAKSSKGIDAQTRTLLGHAPSGTVKPAWLPDGIARLPCTMLGILARPSADFAVPCASCAPPPGVPGTLFG